MHAFIDLPDRAKANDTQLSKRTTFILLHLPTFARRLNERDIRLDLDNQSSICRVINHREQIPCSSI
jgi:hypothetical protein